MDNPVEKLPCDAKYPWLGAGPVSIKPYICEDFYSKEIDKVFKKTWLVVGRVEEFPKPRNYKMRQLKFADTSAIIIRGKDDKFRAFHNVCTHRGNKLVSECTHRPKNSLPQEEPPTIIGRSTMLTCHFHGWSFNDRGELMGVPEEGKFPACFEKKMANLKTIHCDVWAGFIFINLDENPKQSLQEFMGEFGDWYADYPYHEISNKYKWHTNLNCNWKVGLDAFAEAYHVSTIHAHPNSSFPPVVSTDVGSVDLFDLHRSAAVMDLPEEEKGELSAVTKAAMEGAMNASLMQVGDRDILPDPLKMEGEPLNFQLGMIFPNTIIHVSRGIWFSHQFWPTSVGTCLWEGRYYMREPDSNSEHWAQEYLAKIQHNLWLEDTATMEDTYDAIKSGALEHMWLQDEEILIRHNVHLCEKFVNEE